MSLKKSKHLLERNLFCRCMRQAHRFTPAGKARKANSLGPLRRLRQSSETNKERWLAGTTLAQRGNTKMAVKSRARRLLASIRQILIQSPGCPAFSQPNDNRGCPILVSSISRRDYY